MKNAHCLLKFSCGFFALIAAIFVSGSAHGMKSTISDQLPLGWEPLIQNGIRQTYIEGYFVSSKQKTRALLVGTKKGENVGLAHIRDRKTVAQIIATFGRIGGDEVTLTMLKPGKYQSICEPRDSACPSYDLKLQSIGVCFGETACQVIHYQDKEFKSFFMTD